MRYPPHSFSFTFSFFAIHQNFCCVGGASPATRMGWKRSLPTRLRFCWPFSRGCIRCTSISSPSVGYFPAHSTIFSICMVSIFLERHRFGNFILFLLIIVCLDCLNSSLKQYILLTALQLQLRRHYA